MSMFMFWMKLLSHDLVMYFFLQKLQMLKVVGKCSKQFALGAERDTSKVGNQINDIRNVRNKIQEYTGKE